VNVKRGGNGGRFCQLKGRKEERRGQYELKLRPFSVKSERSPRSACVEVVLPKRKRDMKKKMICETGPGDFGH